jgi:hypothetical protein
MVNERIVTAERPSGPGTGRRHADELLDADFLVEETLHRWYVRRPLRR